MKRWRITLRDDDARMSEMGWRELTSTFVIPGSTRDPAFRGTDRRLVSSGTPDQVRSDYIVKGGFWRMLLKKSAFGNGLKQRCVIRRFRAESVHSCRQI
ncbi:hypothetical protein CDQ91_02265 [Sphingopyxis witflariensis]|uniref:Uncharacterized protein n=1 Tax=Sphingopyxis witflariensis TaxID=173675 RepID=A0A246K5I4_9SPHN|nr:hypothetical protein CDQ91_02265 [Sphingopyxis witflariensis]